MVFNWSQCRLYEILSKSMQIHSISIEIKNNSMIPIEISKASMILYPMQWSINDSQQNQWTNNGSQAKSMKCYEFKSKPMIKQCVPIETDDNYTIVYPNQRKCNAFLLMMSINLNQSQFENVLSHWTISKPTNIQWLSIQINGITILININGNSMMFYQTQWTINKAK